MFPDVASIWNYTRRTFIDRCDFVRRLPAAMRRKEQLYEALVEAIPEA